MQIACECWFTSQGKIQPLMFKYRDDQGVVHTIKEIQVHSRAETNLMTSPYTEFDVTVNCQGLYIKTKLVFYKKECRWVMVTGDGWGQGILQETSWDGGNQWTAKYMNMSL